jgi:hypothetical protein
MGETFLAYLKKKLTLKGNLLLELGGALVLLFQDRLLDDRRHLN